MLSRLLRRLRYLARQRRIDADLAEEFETVAFAAANR
jgi:hypothetical protein